MKIVWRLHGNGGAYLAWADGRRSGVNTDIYMQHVKGDSTSSWTQNGILISDEQSYFPTPILSPGPNNTVYVAWEDVRDGHHYLWTQRINPDSTAQWQDEGVATADKVHNYSGHKTFTSEDGSMIMVFTDQKQVYAKKIHADGTLGTPTAIVDNRHKQIESFSLYQNYPNPFNPETVITFSLNRKGHVLLEVYDILGKKITTLINGTKNNGFHSVKFNAVNFASGVYYYTIRTDDFVKTRKMLLLR